MRLYFKNIFIISLCLICNNLIADENSNSENYIKAILRHSVSHMQYDTTTLKEGDYSISVMSQYIHLNKDERPIYLNQNVLLKYKDTVIYNKIHKAIKDTITINNKKIIYIENFIVQIGIIEGLKENLFCIEGYGGCSTCTEYAEIFNRQGESIYLYYHDNVNTYSQSGNLQTIFKRYTISEKNYRQSKYIKKRIILGLR